MATELDDIVRKESITWKALKKAAEPFVELGKAFTDDIGLRLSAFMAINSAKETAKKAGKAAAGALASLPFYVLAHEALHSLSLKIAGNGVNYFGIRPVVGGGLLQKIFPGVSTNLNEFSEVSPLAMGTVGAAETSTVPASLFYYTFPYILTPLGICLMRKGKNMKSRFIEGMGLLVALAPFKGATVDFLDIMKKCGAENEAIKYAGAAAITAGIYIGSKYAADGLEAVAEKLTKRKCFFSGKLAAAKYYAALMCSALALGYLGQPNMPIRQSPAKFEEGRKMLQILYNSGRYEEMLGTGLEGKKEYGGHFMLCYAQLVAEEKMGEEYAVSRLSGKHRERFYIYLGLDLIHQKKYDEALEAVSKMPDTPENLDQINWARRIIYFTQGQDVRIKGKNISMGADPGRAREYFEEAMGLYKKALSFETEMDPTLLKSVNSMIAEMDDLLGNTEF